MDKVHALQRASNQQNRRREECWKVVTILRVGIKGALVVECQQSRSTAFHTTNGDPVPE